MNRLDKDKNRENFRLLLGLKEYEIYDRKEYSIVSKIKKIFKNQIINEQYGVDKYFIDLVFPVQKLGIDIDENNHTGRCKIKEDKEKK